jgi:hypothetical protein
LERTNSILSFVESNETDRKVGNMAGGQQTYFNNPDAKAAEVPQSIAQEPACHTWQTKSDVQNKQYRPGKTEVTTPLNPSQNKN